MNEEIVPSPLEATLPTGLGSDPHAQRIWLAVGENLRHREVSLPQHRLKDSLEVQKFFELLDPIKVGRLLYDSVRVALRTLGRERLRGRWILFIDAPDGLKIDGYDFDQGGRQIDGTIRRLHSEEPSEERRRYFFNGISRDDEILYTFDENKQQPSYGNCNLTHVNDQVFAGYYHRPLGRSRKDKQGETRNIELVAAKAFMIVPVHGKQALAAPVSGSLFSGRLTHDMLREIERWRDGDVAYYRRRVVRALRDALKG